MLSHSPVRDLPTYLSRHQLVRAEFLYYSKEPVECKISKQIGFSIIPKDKKPGTPPFPEGYMNAVFRITENFSNNPCTVGKTCVYITYSEKYYKQNVTHINAGPFFIATIDRENYFESKSSLYMWVGAQKDYLIANTARGGLYKHDPMHGYVFEAQENPGLFQPVRSSLKAPTQADFQEAGLGAISDRLSDQLIADLASKKTYGPLMRLMDLYRLNERKFNFSPILTEIDKSSLNALQFVTFDAILIAGMRNSFGLNNSELWNSSKEREKMYRKHFVNALDGSSAKLLIGHLFMDHNFIDIRQDSTFNEVLKSDKFNDPRVKQVMIDYTNMHYFSTLPHQEVDKEIKVKFDKWYLSTIISRIKKDAGDVDLTEVEKLEDYIHSQLK